MGRGLALIEATKTSINLSTFTQITVLAKGMQVAEVVGAAFGKGNNVVDVQWRLVGGFTAALALMAIAF
jgi:hypothetical protein